MERIETKTKHTPFIKRQISCLERFGWLVVLRINVDLAIFQPYLDLEAGDNQSLKIQVARPGIEPRSSCSASQELNDSTTAAPMFGKKSRLKSKPIYSLSQIFSNPSFREKESKRVSLNTSQNPNMNSITDTPMETSMVSG